MKNSDDPALSPGQDNTQIMGLDFHNPRLSTLRSRHSAVHSLRPGLGGKTDAPKGQRVFWAALEGVIAGALLYGGGHTALSGRLSYFANRES